MREGREKENPLNHQQLCGCLLNLAPVSRRAWPVQSLWEAMEQKALGVHRRFPTEMRAGSWKIKYMYKKASTVLQTHQQERLEL